MALSFAWMFGEAKPDGLDILLGLLVPKPSSRTIQQAVAVEMTYERLEEMKVQNIPLEGDKKQYDVVDKGGDVILPAFGSAVDEMMTLSEKNVQIVDTTCP